MLNLWLSVFNWLNGQEGQDLAEYALLLGLVVVVVIVAVIGLGNNLLIVFNAAAEAVATVTEAAAVWVGGGT